MGSAGSDPELRGNQNRDRKPLEQNWGLGYIPHAVFDYRLDVSTGLSESRNPRQALSSATNLASKHGMSTVIFAMPHTRRE